jgi:hypothetical protein
MSTATRASPTLIPLFAASLSGSTSMTRSSVILEPAPQVSGTLSHLAPRARMHPLPREYEHTHPVFLSLTSLMRSPTPHCSFLGRLVHAWRFRRATTVARANRAGVPAEQHWRTLSYRMRAGTPHLTAAVLPMVPA